MRYGSRCKRVSATSRSFRTVFSGAVLLVTLGQSLSGFAVAPELTTIEAEDAAAEKAEVFRDKRASKGRCSGVVLSQNQAILVAAPRFPAGDYEVTFWLEVTPVNVIHGLAVSLHAGRSSVTLGQIQFDERPGYRPYAIRCNHLGGPMKISASASGGTGFEGMRKGISDQERSGLKITPSGGGDLLADNDMDALWDDLDGIDEERSVASLKVFDHRVLCDKVTIRPLGHPGSATVSAVEVDKIHYLPGETVNATVHLSPGALKQPYVLVAEEITGLASTREVWRLDLGAAEGNPELHFSYELNDREFGHELRCSVTDNGSVIHSASALFGVSRNVYRIAITARPGPQDMRNFTVAAGAALMRENKRAYANCFERFAWAPCDYSMLAPETEIFYSGQTQYPGSRTGFKNLINEAHKVGIKVITYGKACAAGIAGFETFQRFPQYFTHRAEGTATESMSVFYLERMLANDYLLHAKPSEGGWHHWTSLWTDMGNKETVLFGAQAIIDSIEMFGWDGVRWDGHFVGNQKLFLDLLRERYPKFVHGYNIAFADPRSSVFTPPDGDRLEDFHKVAERHGLMMDESVRSWSNTNFSPGYQKPFYESLCREADYIKRIGGLPLFIVFDMASPQDRTFNVLCGLAAGQRYTYITSPGDFLYGPLPKFLTRYSAYIWDDTKRVASPAKYISVTRDQDDSGSAPWWQTSSWLRTLDNGRQQLLVNLVNPPGYNQFCNRVQTPPSHTPNVSVHVRKPLGATLTKAFLLSPDMAAGHVLMTPGDGSKNAAGQLSADADGHTVRVDELRTWGIVGFEYEGAPTPAFAVTTPIEDAAAFMAKQPAADKKSTRKEAIKAGVAPNEFTVPKVPAYKDYTRSVNTDIAAEETMKKPADLSIRRNGVLDVHHARGAFSWFNPVDIATALHENGVCTPSWVNLVGFKLRDKGCMDEFPDGYDKLLEYDVIAVDNVHARHLGTRRRVMLADFVRNGGGLLLFGGYYNISLGADHNTYAEELLPVKITTFANIVYDRAGLLLKPETPDIFPGVDWSKPAYAFTVDISPLKPGARVLMRAGKHPAIVSQTYGKGRVITVLINSHGDYAEETVPYWEWADWPKVISACIGWLGEGAQKKKAPTHVKKVDPTKITPEELLIESLDMNSADFTRKLTEASANMVDAESAKLLLETAVENVDKIQDMNVLQKIANQAMPYFDPSFAELGIKLANSKHEFMRQSGYRFLGMAGDSQYRPILERALREKSPELEREALTGLWRLHDPKCLPAVEQYLREGSEKMLALLVMLRNGREDVLKQLLPLYEQALVRKIRLKSGRGSIIDTLWGGTSFTLTPAQRRKAMGEYHEVLRREAIVQHDLQLFARSIRELSNSGVEVLVEFFAQSKTREIMPVAYSVLSMIEGERGRKFRAGMATAELPELRLLAK